MKVDPGVWIWWRRDRKIVTWANQQRQIDLPPEKESSYNVSKI